MGGRNQAAHIHGGGFAKIHTLRIDQNHLTRRCDASQNLAGVVVRHAVQGDRLGIGLLKMHLRLATDIEAFPIHHCTVAGLVDGQGVAVLADGGLTGRDLTAYG